MQKNIGDEKLLARIAIDSKIMVGKPVIAGTRLSVEHVLSLLAQGATFDEILGEYKGLQPEDLAACLLFAAKIIQDSTFLPLAKESA